MAVVRGMGAAAARREAARLARVVHAYSDAIIVLLTLPFYVSVLFHDTYIDEGF